MDIIPAIDVRGGRCVRLSQGREDAETMYDPDPVRVARRWREEGASRLHLVNLDGAFGRDTQATGILREIARVEGLRVQFGGGLRTHEAIRTALDAGASRAVIGTAALENTGFLSEALRAFGTDRIIVALDSRNGIVETRGWKASTGKDVADAAHDVAGAGVKYILYTDIGRDGMLSGPDIATLGRLAATGLSVIASGGVSSLDDVRALAGVGGLAAVIIGKALYEGRVSLRAAIELAGGL